MTSSIPKRALLMTCVAALGSAALLLAFRSPADAVSTRRFLLDDAASLAAGELDGTAVHSDGSVTAGAELRRIAMDDVPVAWTFARSSDGTVFIGTGNDGKIYRLRGDAMSEFAETGQLLVSALAWADGTLYAGTLPEGRIYRIDGAGQATEITRPDGVEHVWDLVWDARRSRLFAATGPEGKVYAIDSSGRADVYWDSDAAHVMTLALDGDGTLYAGTNDDAIVVRLRGPGRAEVVYDFPGNEVTSIAVRDGALAVAANDFPAPPSAPSTSTKTTKITKAGITTSTSSSSRTAARPRTGKGRLWRVAADGRAERVYANDGGHFTSVQLDSEGTIWAGSGKDGRVYRVAADRTSATWIDVDERQVTAIDLTGNEPLLLTSDAAAVYRVVSGRPRNAVWTSKVQDASFSARFGQISWRGAGALRFQTRSGNREEPDDTWSEWSASTTTPGPIRSPGARFLQIRATFPADADAVLRAVAAFYLPQNQRATVSEVRLHKGSSSSKGKSKSSKSAQRDRPPTASSRYKLGWMVENADGDELRYRLRFRAEAQTVWRDMLRESERLTEKEYTWETSGIPDGWYVVRVEASDELSNPEGVTLRSTADSEPLLIDNHAPALAQLGTAGTTVTGRARDSLGPIARLEVAVDGGEWRDFYPDDDLLDTADERFAVDVAPLEPGDHIVAVRTTDAGGNTVTAEVTLTVP